MTDSAAYDTLVAPQESNKLAFWLFLGGEVVFFAALILVLLLSRFSHPTAFAAFREGLSVPLIGVNTFVLITSSYGVVRALEASRRGQNPSLMRNLGMVIGLGVVFLAGQAFEWSALFARGESFQTLMGMSFFTVTGIHGTHVLVGLIWCVAMVGLIRRPSSSSATPAVELFGLYWHFVDVVWIVLFTAIYLI